ncbi:MAG TPA: hypothetical protein ENH10_03025 [Bacteroidetes bacterium]|nr:hypothetical protein BMS3Bbin04_01645 [bacterium BMS3Bbin04]HDO64989.1 hypothetical protein [Bacteroidota bacterium]HEX04114.1 hypothetical protein [Bacteroidota bacterium]
MSDKPSGLQRLEVVLDTCVWIMAHESGSLDALLLLGRDSVNWLIPWEKDPTEATIISELQLHLPDDAVTRILNDPGGPAKVDMDASDVLLTYRIHQQFFVVPSRSTPRSRDGGRAAANEGEAAGIAAAIKKEACFCTNEKDKALTAAKAELGQSKAFHFKDLMIHLEENGITLPSPLFGKQKRKP